MKYNQLVERLANAVGLTLPAAVSFVVETVESRLRGADVQTRVIGEIREALSAADGEDVVRHATDLRKDRDALRLALDRVRQDSGCPDSETLSGYVANMRKDRDALRVEFHKDSAAVNDAYANKREKENLQALVERIRRALTPNGGVDLGEAAERWVALAQERGAQLHELRSAAARRQEELVEIAERVNVLERMRKHEKAVSDSVKDVLRKVRAASGAPRGVSLVDFVEKLATEARELREENDRLTQRVLRFKGMAFGAAYGQRGMIQRIADEAEAVADRIVAARFPVATNPVQAGKTKAAEDDWSAELTGDGSGTALPPVASGDNPAILPTAARLSRLEGLLNAEGGATADLRSDLLRKLDQVGQRIAAIEKRAVRLEAETTNKLARIALRADRVERHCGYGPGA